MNTDSSAKPLGTLLLSVSALGVILGDIGTSPLYAFKELMHVEHVEHSPANILGALSLFFWAMMLIGTIQYAWIFMRVHYDGEGGGLALYALLERAKKAPYGMKTLIIVGIALTVADGMITPAISVMSAVEGLDLLVPGVQTEYGGIPESAWISVAILGGLFWVQRYGTHKIGGFFGPVMVVWFLAIGLLGLNGVFKAPLVLQAVNPWWAWEFVRTQHAWELLEVLGRVALCVTGAEALYADRGHFTQNTIRIAWGYALPCLLLNYFGQGALVLSGVKAENYNYFFALCPSREILIVTLILATLATIIASQAMITGTFSLMKQAVNLDLFPRVRIVHTNPEHRAQIFLPVINTLLGLGAIGMVFFFETSSKIAAAYGISVFGAMLVTTIAYCVVARRILNYHLSVLTGLGLVFFCSVGTFFVANSIKFLEGGYVSVMIGGLATWMMYSWQWGRKYVETALAQRPHTTIEKLFMESDTLIKRPCIIISPEPIYLVEEDAPILLQQWWQRYYALPEKIIFLYVHPEPIPYVAPENRVRLLPVKNDYLRALKLQSLELFHGYMEELEFPEILQTLIQQGQVADLSWLVLWQEENFVTEPSTRHERLLLATYAFLVREASKYVNSLNLDKRLRSLAVQIDI